MNFNSVQTVALNDLQNLIQALHSMSPGTLAAYFSQCHAPGLSHGNCPYLAAVLVNFQPSFGSGISLKKKFRSCKSRVSR